MIADFLRDYKMTRSEQVHPFRSPGIIPGGLMLEQSAEKVLKCHCEERFCVEAISSCLEILNDEFASLRSQRQAKDFFSDLLAVIILKRREQQEHVRTKAPSSQ